MRGCVMQKVLDEPGCGEDERGSGERGGDGDCEMSILLLEVEMWEECCSVLPVANGAKSSAASVSGSANEGCGMSSRRPVIAARAGHCAAVKRPGRSSVRAFCATGGQQ